jgi:hypothetical protein
MVQKTNNKRDFQVFSKEDIAFLVEEEVHAISVGSCFVIAIKQYSLLKELALSQGQCQDKEHLSLKSQLETALKKIQELEI